MTTTTMTAPERTKTTTAAIYTRISSDDLRLGRGVQRQLEDARHLVQQRGWEVGGEFSDNDVSAFSGADRPGYQSMVAALESGRIDQIIVVHQSRLWRNRRERVAGIELLARLRVGMVALNGPTLDFSTSGGRFLADVLGAFDSSESDVKSERLQDESRKRAEAGKPNGRAPYGWRREYHLEGTRLVSDGDFEDPETAPIVRELVQRIVAGEPLSRIAKDFIQRGLPSPGFLARRQRPGDEEVARRSNPWVGIALKQLALRDANIGLRKHRGVVVGKAAWPAIVDKDMHDRAVAILTAPERHQHRDGKRHHLLTHGIGVCDVCKGELGARNKSGHLVYRCAGPGCITRDMVKVDALVDAVMVARLGQPDAAAVFDVDDAAAQEARERAAAVRARLDNAATDYADGAIDGQQLRVVTSRLRPQLEAAEADLRRHQAPSLPEGMDKMLRADSAERAALWTAATVVSKRTIMSAMNVTVTIMPMKRSGPGSFDEDEVVIE